MKTASPPPVRVSPSMYTSGLASARDTFEVGAGKPLFQTNPSRPGDIYDVTGDGKRFLVNTALQEQTSTPLTLVVNWTAALKK